MANMNFVYGEVEIADDNRYLVRQYMKDVYGIVYSGRIFLPEGKGKNANPEDFDLEQIAMGIDVEFEHTDDPYCALEMALDHLVELPDYYTRLKEMEEIGKAELDLPLDEKKKK